MAALTPSAVADYRSIFPDVTEAQARVTLAAAVETATLQRTKRNGAQVLRTGRPAGRCFLLVHQGKVVAVGPPSGSHLLPESYARWTPKPGEEGPEWWLAQAGDVEAPPPPDATPPTRRDQAHPVAAELRLLAEQAGMVKREIGERIGASPGRVGNILNGKRQPEPEEEAAMRAIVLELRRQLGMSRPAHRPRSRDQALDVQLSGRVTQDLADWVQQQGGWAYVRQLLEREMTDRR